MTFVLGLQFWRYRPPNRPGMAWTAAVSLLALAAIASCTVNMFYQRLLPLRAWPASGIFDQVIVASNGDVFAKFVDPIVGRTNRVQRYNSRGAFQAAFVPDNGGGLYKIAVDKDRRLEVYSVRTDTVDVFAPDGSFRHRTIADSTSMPFDFLREGPSVLENNNYRYTVNPGSGRPAIFSIQEQSYSDLEAGDWLVEHVLSRRNIFALAILGLLFLLVSYLRERPSLQVRGT